MTDCGDAEPVNTNKPYTTPVTNTFRSRTKQAQGKDRVVMSAKIDLEEPKGHYKKKSKQFKKTNIYSLLNIQ